MTSKQAFACLLASALIFAKSALAAPQAKVENCGWLVPNGNALVTQPDALLKPSDPAALSTPPPQAKAAYCERDTMMSYVGDERVIKFGLPLVIRSGGDEGVLEANPTVLFNYHRVGEQYLPGKIAALAQVRPTDMAVRQVEGNVLVSPDQPKIRLKVGQAFAALPVLAFPIRQDTWVERYIFVDSGRDMRVRRLVVVQFEHAQVGSSFRFVYPSKPPMSWGSAVYRHGAFTADTAKEIAEHPDLEVARTEAYLNAKGYRLTNWWNVARLARAADPEGKTEIIVFYQESLAVPPSGALAGKTDEDLPEKEARRLFENLKSAVWPD
jgi:hypothetical protein